MRRDADLGCGARLGRKGAVAERFDMGSEMGNLVAAIAWAICEGTDGRNLLVCDTCLLPAGSIKLKECPAQPPIHSLIRATTLSQQIGSYETLCGA